MTTARAGGVWAAAVCGTAAMAIQLLIINNVYGKQHQSCCNFGMTCPADSCPAFGIDLADNIENCCLMRLLIGHVED